MRSPELEVYLSSGFHVHWSVLALRSMDPLIVLWVRGTMEEDASGEEMQMRADPLSDPVPEDPKTPDPSAVSA